MIGVQTDKKQTDRQTHRLSDWLTDWMNDGQTDKQMDGRMDRLTDWLADWLTDRRQTTKTVSNIYSPDIAEFKPYQLTQQLVHFLKDRKVLWRRYAPGQGNRQIKSLLHISMQQCVLSRHLQVKKIMSTWNKNEYQKYVQVDFQIMSSDVLQVMKMHKQYIYCTLEGWGRVQYHYNWPF